MLDVQPKATVDFPDSPSKWDGWSKYKAENPYERLCLDPREHPSEEQIQQHCAALLLWWQKKLPLKSQPSNPMAQLLGRGLDEAAQFLVQARMQLLDPEQRQQVDDNLAARAEQEALADFSKYVAFSLARRVLTAEAEANLAEFGKRSGLNAEQTRKCIEQELRRHKAQRVAPIAQRVAQAAPGTPEDAAAEKEFRRILALSKLDLGDATLLVRRIFVTLAESLGLAFERAEDLLDDYLEHAEYDADESPASYEPPVTQPAPVTRPLTPPASKTAAPAPVAAPVSHTPTAPSPPHFVSPSGAPMILIPGGDFVMGSEAPDAAPNEQPLTPVTLTEFYMSRFPVTNAQYEQFEPGHRQKRMKGAAADHPVVYVSSHDAVRYCQWLSQKDGRTYRLPTEAEWEYAARGTDGRKYPWGNERNRRDYANFADASTNFAWRDAKINDGFPETSPVGAFPGGASFFGIEDMAGNVWEWCLDFYQPLQGTPKRNPRGLVAGPTRLYRGGSWKSRFTNLRATARSSNAANFASNDVGFRIICECGSADANASAEPARA